LKVSVFGSNLPILLPWRSLNQTLPSGSSSSRCGLVEELLGSSLSFRLRLLPLRRVGRPLGLLGFGLRLFLFLQLRGRCCLGRWRVVVGGRRRQSHVAGGVGCDTQVTDGRCVDAKVANEHAVAFVTRG
jgi:hypothetical protein